MEKLVKVYRREQESKGISWSQFLKQIDHCLEVSKNVTRERVHSFSEGSPSLKQFKFVFIHLKTQALFTVKGEFGFPEVL